MSSPPGPHPFDAVASGYDERFTRSRVGRMTRRAVRRYLGELVAAGDNVLELGCGTGEDAVWMAQRGVHVTATDASPAMLEIAAGKARAAGVDDRLAFAPLDLTSRDVAEPPLPPSGFDAVVANFGVLNCLPERRSLAAQLSDWIRPGGHAALVLMSPLCPWEIAWHVAHGRGRDALRRLRKGGLARIGNGSTLRVWYPSPRTLHRELAPGFAHVRTVGIGVLLPPSYLESVVERWPGFFERLSTWDRRLGPRRPWTWLNDHYLAVYRRR